MNCTQSVEQNINSTIYTVEYENLFAKIGILMHDCQTNISNESVISTKQARSTTGSYVSKMEQSDQWSPGLAKRRDVASIGHADSVGRADSVGQADSVGRTDNTGRGKLGDQALSHKEYGIYIMRRYLL